MLENMLEKGRMDKNTDTHDLDAPPDAVQKIIHCSRRDVEGVWWSRSSPGQGSTMGVPGCRAHQSTAWYWGCTLRLWFKPQHHSAMCPMCSQPDGGKTHLTSLECRSESPLVEERVELFNSRWVLPRLDSHRRRHHFWSCFNKESHVPHVTSTEHFICYVFGQWGPGMVVWRSFSLHLPMPFFSHGLFFCIRQLWLHP